MNDVVLRLELMLGFLVKNAILVKKVNIKLHVTKIYKNLKNDLNLIL